MKKNKSLFFIEILKPTLSVVISYTIIALCLEIKLSNGTFEFQFHDTYLILEPFYLYLLIGIPIYYILQVLFLGFSKNINKISFILFVFAGLLLGLVFWLMYPFINLAKKGFTVYPAMDVLGNNQLNGMIRFLFPIELFLVIFTFSILWICFKFVKQKKNTASL